VPMEDPVLARIIQEIIHLVHPLRIILFGSAARGTAQSGSDLDLMVICRRRREHVVDWPVCTCSERGAARRLPATQVRQAGRSVCFQDSGGWSFMR
jgi:hypothetical protein